ncbi:hypothetical protein GCK72_021390 [Caenorhabditis remanei]|uniref:F-box domain-containing protein n=1 Tax=Caenorhabditis remanei TaxID=31234 RepID=A0A6A5GJP1_CAERE|nr:hypothetical protein GCK72_021390 [Caenorhabditis remanei]KAF1754826.1 hypothetical protein GCK72_021390 [Caenorhabditis remanei]
MSLKPSTLLNLPDVAKDHLMEYLNYIDIARLRKTCHVFRQYLTVKEPDANIPSIQVLQDEKIMKLSFEARFRERLVKIEYKKVNDGCSIEANFPQGDTVVRADGRNYLDVFCQDFSMLLTHQKSISREVDFIALRAPGKRTEFWDTIRRVLEDTRAATGTKSLLKKKSLTLRNLMAPDVFSILPYFDPNCMENINLTGEYEEAQPLNGIVELPLWNHLKNVTLDHFFIGNIPQNITHLETFTGNVREITAEDVLQIKNMMLRSGQLKCCYISNWNQDESFQQTLGPIFVEGEGQKTWKFDSPIPGNVLRVTCNGRLVCFNRILAR